MKVKKGDEVVVLAGKDIGQRGTITRVIPDTRQGDRTTAINMVKRHTKPRGQVDAGRHHRQGDADPRVERRAVVQGVRRDPRRLPLRRRRREGPHLPQVRRRRLMAADDHRTPAPASSASRPSSRRSSRHELGLANVMQVPRLVKIVVNMGVGRATQQRSLLDGAVTDLTIITGQKPLGDARRRSRSRTSSCVRATRSAPR